MFKTISEVRTANQALGRYFFSKQTMRFFNSKVYPRIIKGCMFVTSEQFDEKSERLFTVRVVSEEGEVNTLSKFQQFRSKKEANAWAKQTTLTVKA